jgi:hypothetical protein
MARVAKENRHDAAQHYTITGDLDEHIVAAIRLETLALAKRYGLKIEEFRLEKGEGGSST